MKNPVEIVFLLTCYLVVVTSQAGEENLPAANPWVAASSYAISHHIVKSFDDNVAATTGGVIVVDRELQVQDYVLFPGEHVENSIAVDEDKLVVNSTYPEPGPIDMDLISNAFLAGTTRKAPLGIQKYEWLREENRFVESWSIAEVDNTDWLTGEKKATWVFPDDSVLWNNWGGITVFLKDGDFLLGGFFAIKRFNTGDMG